MIASNTTLKVKNIITICSERTDSLFTTWISNRNNFIPNICSCCHCITDILNGGYFEYNNQHYTAPVCLECLEKADLDIDNDNQLVKL